MARRPNPHLVASTLLLCAAGCSQLLGALEEELEQKVVEENTGLADGGRGGGGGGGGEEPEVEINSIQPARGLTAGGESVEIIGIGFVPDMQVFFGDVQADPLTVTIDDYSIHCVTPAAAAAGRVTVRVIGAEISGFLQDGFEYYEPIDVVAITPTRGPTEGGTEVTVTGTGFAPGSTVQFGTTPPIQASVVDGSTLVVPTPPLARARWAVTVTNANGTDTLPAAFMTYEPLRVRGVVPAAGPIAGGTAIAVVGSGFVPGSALELGGQLVATGAPNSAESELTAVTPPAAPAVEGAAAARVDNEIGSFTLPNAFVYYDPTNPTPRIIAVTPSTGLIEGGREVSVVVGGMPDTGTQVFFGATEATCTVHDLFLATCNVPPAAEGPVDVRVVNGAINEVLAGGFTYIDLRIDAILPNRGAIAGNSWVRLAGSGFAADARVYFDGRAASIAGVTPTEITLRTPPRALTGVVDVRVETQDVALTADDAFTYFDPFASMEWTSGGPIDGSINVTVINDHGETVEGAMVIVGPTVDAARPHLYGFSNARGQITLSGPELVGPQSVHAGKTKCLPDSCDDRGHGNFSWVDINAQNLVVMLSSLPEPPPDPLPDCPEGDGAPPPLVRGTVYRIKDEYNTGNDYVVVTTTYPSLSSNLPDPGPKSQMVSRGPYEIMVRTGDLSVMALAGRVTPEGTLDPHAIGFHPFLTIEPSSGGACSAAADCLAGEECTDFGVASLCQRVYDGVDIVVDTPLNQPLRVELDDPPLGIASFTFPAAPSVTNARVWYDLGHMGVFAMTNYPLTPGLMGMPPPAPLSLPGTDILYFDMPRALPADISSAVFNVFAEVYGESPYTDFSYSESYAQGLSDTRQTVVLTPMLRVNSELRPALLTSADTNDAVFTFEPLPATSAPDPTAHVHFMFNVLNVPMCIGPFGPMAQPEVFTYWMVMGPGTSETFQLPRFPESMSEANFPARELVIWQIASPYSPGVDINNTTLDAVFYYTSMAGRLTAFCTDLEPGELCPPE